jgi:hypothetical protein
MFIHNFGRLAGSLLLCSVLAIAGGCGSGGNTGKVTGTVTFDGAPVPDGQITFESDTVTGAQIKDGKFEADVPVGKHKVKIVANREEGVAADGLPNFVSYIPKKYNEQTTLEEEVKSGKNEFTFDLTK